MNTTKKERIQGIHNMLLEMASGNFFYRLERHTKNDNLEAISISLNMLAEEIQEIIIHQGFANSNNPMFETVQMSFILDETGTIEMANQQSCYLLSLASQDIIGKPFEKILDTTSLAKWKVLWTSFLQKKKTESTIALKFRTKSGLVISKTAHLTALTESKKEQIKILITIILHSNHQIELDNKLKQSVHQFSTHQKKTHKETLVKPAKSKIRLSFEDIRKIREGHTFILNNLGKDFPSLKDFAHQLGTNEFKLKYGFRELYGTSVYRFLKQERFRKAQMLVQYGDQSIKSIANISGFKSFSHFSRTFKKRYGYTPSELRKKSLNQG